VTSVPRNTVPRNTVPRYLVPRYLVPRYPVPRYPVPRYPVPRYLVPRYLVAHGPRGTRSSWHTVLVAHGPRNGRHIQSPIPISAFAWCAAFVARRLRGTPPRDALPPWHAAP